MSCLLLVLFAKLIIETGFYHYTRLPLYVLACVLTSSNKDMYVCMYTLYDRHTHEQLQFDKLSLVVTRR